MEALLQSHCSQAAVLRQASTHQHGSELFAPLPLCLPGAMRTEVLITMLGPRGPHDSIWVCKHRREMGWKTQTNLPALSLKDNLEVNFKKL